MSEAQPQAVTIPPLGLNGDLTVPANARGLVIFAHGSGSSRFSPRNREVAEALVDAGLATLLMDLLSDDEAADRANVFDIPLLAARLADAVEWASTQERLRGLAVGLFGASTGAAAALLAAAAAPERVSAVVSRGGRPDLASPRLGKVRAPTLLIVGGDDEPVLGWNREALAELGGEGRLEVIPGATHLFEEPGALERVTALARAWFLQTLARPSAA
ncbi:MAG: dienelactone hydrolase family protein [Parcubacteria group bacterium]